MSFMVRTSRGISLIFERRSKYSIPAIIARYPHRGGGSLCTTALMIFITPHRPGALGRHFGYVRAVSIRRQTRRGIGVYPSKGSHTKSQPDKPCISVQHFYCYRLLGDSTPP